MTLKIVCSLFLCLALVPSQGAPATKLSSQIQSLVSYVNTGFNSLGSILRTIKQAAQEERAKLFQLTANVRRLEEERSSSDSLKQSILLLKTSVKKLETMVHECDKGWTRRRGKCYKFQQCSRTDKCRGDDVQHDCTRQGARLASVRSSEENEFLASLVTKTQIKNVFLGGRDDVIVGRWLWPDGSWVSYTNWDENQPDGGSIQNCMVLWRNRNNRWDDGTCSVRYNRADTGYICEKHLWD